jgi:hypothetical protein
MIQSRLKNTKKIKISKWMVEEIQEYENYCKVNIAYVSFLSNDHASPHLSLEG